PGRGLHPSGWSRVPGDHRLIVTHERGDLPRPMVWSTEDGAMLEPVIDLPGETGASWFPDGRALLIWHDHRGRTELHRLTLADGAQLERVDTPPGTIEAAAIRPDGSLWISRSDAATPPELRAGRQVLLQPPGPVAPGGAPYRDVQI